MARVVGFNDKDADDLLNLIGDVESPNGLPQLPFPLFRLYRFTLNATLASGTADADILEMDGTDTNIDATVRDPLGIFADLTTVGDAGLCLYQDGKYYVIQAPRACP